MSNIIRIKVNLKIKSLTDESSLWKACYLEAPSFSSLVSLAKKKFPIEVIDKKVIKFSYFEDNQEFQIDCHDDEIDVLTESTKPVNLLIWTEDIVSANNTTQGKLMKF